MAVKTTPESASYELILKQAAQKKNVIFSISKTYPAYLILIAFLILSYFVWDFFSEKVESDRRNAFDKALNSVMTRFENKYQLNVQILNSITGIYDQKVQVVKDYFQLYSSVPTRNYPSIISMMYIANVSKEKKDTFEFNAERQKMFGYKIRPDGDRDFYYPVYYIENYDTNMYMAGYDLGSEPVTLEAIQKARDEKIIIRTPVFEVRKEEDIEIRIGQTKRDTIVNEWGEQEILEFTDYSNLPFRQKERRGFYLMAPVYLKDSPRETLDERRLNFNGVVIIEIDSKLFFENALGDKLPGDTSIVFKIFESSAGKDEEIFCSDNFERMDDPNPILSDKQVLKIADKEFTVKFSTVKNFGDPLQASMPVISLVISLVLSFVFFGFVLSVSTGKARAMDLAERMTRSQRRIVDSSEDIIAVLSLDGVWKSMNPASLKIFGITPNDMTGSNIDGLFLEIEDSGKFASMISTAKEEYTERIDFRMKDRDGELKWLNWSFTFSPSDKLIYCIGRDVTLEKLAEEQARLRSKQIELAEQFNREASEFKSFFMTKLSHQMRNSLTGILGYIQLLVNEIYDDDEERISFLNLAEESSEEMFTFVSDMMDIATETQIDIATLQLDKTFENVINELKKKPEEGGEIEIIRMEECQSATAVGDWKLLKKAFIQIFRAMSKGVGRSEIQYTASENPYEGATEIQILTNGNPLVSKMIDIFKSNRDNLIEALKDDQEDILLLIAKAESNFRLMNGNMSLDTFGPEEGNVVQLTLPLNKPVSK